MKTLGNPSTLRWGAFSAVLVVTIVAASILLRDDGKRLHVHFFYGENCLICEQKAAYLMQLEGRERRVTVHAYEVYSDADNRDLLVAFATDAELELESVGVPITFFADETVQGFSDRIRDRMQASVEDLLVSGHVSARITHRAIDDALFEGASLTPLGEIGVRE